MATTYQEPTKATKPDENAGYRVAIGRDIIQVISVFGGTKTASEMICEAAVRKILCENLNV